MPHVWTDESGVAWVDDSGSKVIEIAAEHIGCGWTADMILENHPHLMPAQVHAALAWYYDHQEAMDEEMRLRDTRANQLLATMPVPPLQLRLRQLKTQSTQ
jgi:uncharacterized protein (DUF433 family)